MTGNVAELLASAAKERPDVTGLVEAATGRRVSWQDLNEEASRVAAGLSGMGLVAGHRVAICLGNRAEFVSCYLGALRARLVAVPLDPRSATGELARMLADSGARVVVADSATLTSVRAAGVGLRDALHGADEELRTRSVVPRVVVVDAPALPGETRYDDLVTADSSRSSFPPDADALAALLYTSGTSGRPRAAMLTSRALLANIEQAAAVRPPMLTVDDVVLGALPLCAVWGLNGVLGQVLRRRARLVVVDGLDPRACLDVIEAQAVSVLPVAPTMFAHWAAVPDLGHRLRSVRLVLSGSAAGEVATAFTARTGLAVHAGYGLTEAAPAATSTLCSRTRKAGSAGSALPGIGLRLVDEFGAEPEDSDAGEIQIRGENLFAGYWPHGTGGPGPDGWWATGDVGFLDRDADLFLVDRLQELVVVSGFSVYPSEVEEVVAEVDGVAEAAVVGAPEPSTGETVVAYVRRRPGTGRSDDELVASVRVHCAARLAPFKRPTVVRVVGELPHTVSGRVAKGQLRNGRAERVLGLLPVSVPRAPRVLLYSKPGCHLCDDARVVVEAVCRELGETYDEVDVSQSPDLMRVYGEQIPVIFVDGRQHDFWRVDPCRLRAALR